MNKQRRKGTNRMLHTLSLRRH